MRTRLLRPAVLVLCVAPLWALAGGGSGYSGGGGGFDGGGGGFSGGGGGFSFGGGGGSGVHVSGGDVPGWLVIVAIVLFILIKLMAQGQRTRRRGVVRRGHRASRAAHGIGLVQRLRESDPDFDPAAFERRVREAFLKAQRAWSAQSLETIRPFVSDGIAARWELQLAEQRRLDLRDAVEHVRIDEVDLAEVATGDGFDTVTLAIRGQAVDRKLRRSTGEALPGAVATPIDFFEYWSFLRRRGARTRGDRPGLIEGNCPTCGAPVAHSQHARCAYCQAMLRSGEHDWVLAEITQPSEWHGGGPGRVTGHEAFRARDPGFSLQALEDRTSVLFYRWRAAESWGEAERLRGFATADCIAWARGELAGMVDRGGRRHWVGEAAVGAVRTEALQHGEVHDRALVEVRWSGLRSQADRDGTIERGLPTPPRRHYLLLVRDAAATSDVEAVLAGAHCPSCGAPETELVAGTCRACGQARDTGGEWLLSEVHAWSSEAVAKLKRSIGAPRPSASSVLAGEVGRDAPDGTALVAWVAAMAVADGRVDDEETRLLRTLCRQCGVDPVQLPGVLDEARHRDFSELPRPRDVAEARGWFDHLIALAAADGVVDLRERRLLVRLGRHADHEPGEVRRRIRAAERAELQSAKAALRAQKAPTGR